MLITPGSERVKIPKKSDCTEVTSFVKTWEKIANNIEQNLMGVKSMSFDKNYETKKLTYKYTLEGVAYKPPEICNKITYVHL